MRRAAAQTELEKARDAASQVRELEERREAILRMFGTGLRLGLYWFPPHLRRGVYELMGLRVVLHPDGGFSLEGEVSANMVRMSEEVTEFAEQLMEADERTRSAPLDAVERELARVREESTGLRAYPKDTQACRVRFRVPAKPGASPGGDRGNSPLSKV